MKSNLLLFTFVFATFTALSSAQDADGTAGWSRFRGPNGQGVSNDKNIPTEWSDTKNLKWKLDLPGAGGSSPILTDKHVIVTSYSGYGIPGERGGSSTNLKRHLTCVDRKTGKVIWTKSFANEVREDPYTGMGVPEHGYATNTPVTDGKNVYVFFGKSGVFAFDLQGKQLWQKSVGTASANREWGSAASLILVGQKLIVNAADESQTVFCFDKLSGEELWKAQSSKLELCYSTPAILKATDSQTDVVLGVPSAIVGLDLETGKRRWAVSTTLTGNLSPSPTIRDNKVTVFGGYRSSGSMAVTVNESGSEVSTEVDWKGTSSSYVATPVMVDGRFYWIDDRGTYHCVDAESGERIHRARVTGLSSRGRPVYASPIAINNKIYIQTRTNGLIVMEPADEMKIVARNSFESDSSVFNATPAVGNGQLFLRSDKRLYCIEKGASQE